MRWGVFEVHSALAEGGETVGGGGFRGLGLGAWRVEGGVLWDGRREVWRGRTGGNGAL